MSPAEIRKLAARAVSSHSTDLERRLAVTLLLQLALATAERPEPPPLHVVPNPPPEGA